MADEPTGALDTKSGKQVMDIFDELSDNGMTILMITHDFGMLPQYADKAVLIDRTVVKEGAPSDVLNSPEFRQVFHTKGGQL